MANDIPIETYRGIQIYSLGSYTTPYFFTTLNRIKSQSRTIRGVRNWIDKYMAKQNPGVTEGRKISLNDLKRNRLNESAIVPLLHMGGSKKQDLLDQWSDSYLAINDAIKVLQKNGPNARDYNPTDFRKAVEEHKSRLFRLSVVKDELQDMAERLQTQ